MAAPRPLHLAAGLVGTGPQATAADWLGWVRAAAAARLDLVTLQDTRLDPVVLACALAPQTEGIGLVPGIATADTEPFHVSTQVATLDLVSAGRGGWLARVPAREDAVLDGAEHLEVVARLWDSWEDDAEIRDARRHRFLDRDRVHHVDFRGERMSIRGPSITPRPPQGRPPIVLPAGDPALLDVAVAHADVVLVPAWGAAAIAHALESADAAQRAGGRGGERLRVLADLAIPPQASPADVVAEVLAGWEAGLDGFRLLPHGGPASLAALLPGIVGGLRARDAFRTAYEAPTLRGLLGLPRPASRYEAARA